MIDFGDGRQYTVQPSEPSQSPPPSNAEPQADPSNKHSETDLPVSKEERFVDDFDRSWPQGPRHGSSRFSNGPPSSVSSQSMHSPQESSNYTSGDIPCLLKEALSGPDQLYWLATIEYELQALAALSTYDVVSLPNGCSAIGTR